MRWLLTISILAAVLNLSGAEKLRINQCMTGGEPFLQEMFFAVMEDNPDKIELVMDKAGLPEAKKQLQNGEVDLLLLDEMPDEFLQKNYKVAVYRRMPLVVFVNKNSKLSDLSLSDLADIISGKTSDWQKFDAANAFSIHKFGLAKNSNFTDNLRKKLKLKSEDLQFFEADDSKAAALLVESNPNAIGFAAEVEGVKFNKVKVLTIDKLSRTDEQYPLLIKYYAVYPAAKSKMVRQFLGQE